MSNLVLGSVQFGTDYGISSITGQVGVSEIKKILSYAHAQNINIIDTAPSYGRSEQILGETNNYDFKFVTKTRHFNNYEINKDDLILIKKDFYRSLKHLKQKNIYGVLIHNSRDLLKKNGEKLFNQLSELKQDNKVKKIGVSIYEESHLRTILDNFDIDLVQLPFNILDRRLIDNGLLLNLQKRGVEVHARSVFLQGLLLMSETNRPNKFNKWSNLWQTWHQWLHDNRITALEASIKYAISMPLISKVLVGVETKSQLEEIVIASTSNIALPEIPSELYTCDANLLNPVNWKKL
jgi:aryl-alcohol dehydrogenase-like predicted oxidoreductase